MTMKRAWINQPSSLQPDHSLNGTPVLVDMNSAVLHEVTAQKYVDIYFTKGAVISQRISMLSLAFTDSYKWS